MRSTILILILGIGNVASQFFLHESYKREAEYRDRVKTLFGELNEAIKVIGRGTASLHTCNEVMIEADAVLRRQRKVIDRQTITQQKSVAVMRQARLQLTACGNWR